MSLIDSFLPIPSWNKALFYLSFSGSEKIVKTNTIDNVRDTKNGVYVDLIPIKFIKLFFFNIMTIVDHDLIK